MSREQLEAQQAMRKLSKEVRQRLEATQQVFKAVDLQNLVNYESEYRASPDRSGMAEIDRKITAKLDAMDPGGANAPATAQTRSQQYQSPVAEVAPEAAPQSMMSRAGKGAASAAGAITGLGPLAKSTGNALSSLNKNTDMTAKFFMALVIGALVMAAFPYIAPALAAVSSFAAPIVGPAMGALSTVVGPAMTAVAAGAGVGVSSTAITIGTGVILGRGVVALANGTAMGAKKGMDMYGERQDRLAGLSGQAGKVDKAVIAERKDAKAESKGVYKTEMQFLDKTGELLKGGKTISRERVEAQVKSITLSSGEIQNLSGKKLANLYVKVATLQAGLEARGFDKNSPAMQKLAAIQNVIVGPDGKGGAAQLEGNQQAFNKEVKAQMQATVSNGVPGVNRTTTNIVAGQVAAMAGPNNTAGYKNAMKNMQTKASGIPYSTKVGRLDFDPEVAGRQGFTSVGGDDKGEKSERKTSTTNFMKAMDGLESSYAKGATAVTLASSGLAASVRVNKDPKSLAKLAVKVAKMEAILDAREPGGDKAQKIAQLKGQLQNAVSQLNQKDKDKFAASVDREMGKRTGIVNRVAADIAVATGGDSTLFKNVLKAARANVNEMIGSAGQKERKFDDSRYGTSYHGLACNKKGVTPLDKTQQDAVNAVVAAAEAAKAGVNIASNAVTAAKDKAAAAETTLEATKTASAAATKEAEAAKTKAAASKAALDNNNPVAAQEKVGRQQKRSDQAKQDYDSATRDKTAADKEVIRATQEVKNARVNAAEAQLTYGHQKGRYGDGILLQAAERVEAAETALESAKINNTEASINLDHKGTEQDAAAQELQSAQDELDNANRVKAEAEKDQLDADAKDKAAKDKNQEVADQEEALDKDKGAITKEESNLEDAKNQLVDADKAVTDIRKQTGPNQAAPLLASVGGDTGKGSITASDLDGLDLGDLSMGGGSGTGAPTASNPQQQQQQGAGIV